MKVDLAKLGREDSLALDERVPAEAELWRETGPKFEGPLIVELQVRSTASGQVLVQGRLAGRVLQQCRRCLEGITLELDREVYFVFAPSNELEVEPGDEVYELPTRARELDLTSAVREEVVLTTPVYGVCREGCRGLCPRCGQNWNENDCDCALEEPDPRWDALRALNEE